MKIFIVSDVECTIDGVGLLEPGKPVEVDPAYFRIFHDIAPAEANLPRSVRLWYEVDSAEPEEEVAEQPNERTEEVQ